MDRIHRFEALTGIRSLAAWWVVAYHIRGELSGLLAPPLVRLVGLGYLAVDLFFILSGFVIALNFGRLFRRLSIRSAYSFYAIRLARIYPLHIFMLCLFILNPVAIILFSGHASLGDRYSLDYFLLSAVLIQNWGFTDILAWNVPAWSISTEWAAYLVFPVVAWLVLSKLRTSLSALAACAVLMLVLATAANAAGGSLGSNIERFGLIRCMLEFGLGICLFRFWESHGDAPAWHGYLAASAALALIIIYAITPLPDYTVFPLAFFMLIYALTDNRSVITCCLASRFLVWLGTISYSTYLVHFFVRDWVKFLLLRDGVPSTAVAICYFGITFAASAALYTWIEVPGRRWMRSLFSGKLERRVAMNNPANIRFDSVRLP